MNDVITELQTWYASQCNDLWEHGYGIKIDTIDNPGWVVSIDLTDTSLENKVYKQIKIDRDEYDWIDCHVRDKQFEGVGGAGNLREIISCFLEWTKE